MRYFLTFIFLCIGFLSKAEDTTLFKFADSLFFAGDYRLAAIEYERVAYLTESNIVKTEALLKKVECYVWLNNFAHALRILGRVSFYELPEELVARVYYKSAIYAYLEGDFANAESQLMQLHYHIEDKEIRQESLYLFVLVLNELRKWPEAKMKLLELISYSDFTEEQVTEFQEEVEEIYNKNRIPNLKSIEKAKKLSKFLPGAGQIYAGYFLEGIINAGFQVVFLGLTAYGIYAKYYVTAVAIGFTFFQKLHSGAIPRVEYLVNKKNYESANIYNTRLKTFIMDINDKTILKK